MFGTYFDKIDDAPRDIDWFEGLWLGTLVLSLYITFTMFDWSASRLGRSGAAMLTAVRFGGTFLVMLLCTRRKSNFMRWVIAVPFSLTILAYDFTIGFPLGYQESRSGLPEFFSSRFFRPLVLGK